MSSWVFLGRTNAPRNLSISSRFSSLGCVVCQAGLGEAAGAPARARAEEPVGRPLFHGGLGRSCTAAFEPRLLGCCPGRRRSCNGAFPRLPLTRCLIPQDPGIEECPGFR
jgi:hypothetical protein